MLDTMLDFFFSGIVVGLALGVIMWLIVYGVVSILHLFSSMSGE
jgi:hypothetical protein